MNGVAAAILRWSATITLVVLASLVAVWLWQRYETDPWTRDGHVRVDVVRVTTEVSGLITEVHLHDNQPVKSGQLLFVVDRPRYAAALEQVNATIASARAQLDFARKEAARDIALKDLVAAETREQNVARVQTAQATLDQALAERATAALNLERTEVHCHRQWHCDQS
ncbi:MAG: biotin/lipoyl-binding protein [Aliidongia sp.]